MCFLKRKYLPILRNAALMRLFGYLPTYKGYIIGATLAMIIGGGASSLIALVLGKLTDMAFYQQDTIVVYLAPIALVGISILHGGTQYLSQFLLVRVAQGVMLEIRTLMFVRILRWGDELFMKYRCAEVQAKFINEASTALTNAAGVLTIIIRDSIQIVCLLGVLFWHNWLLTLVTFIVGPVIALILKWVNKTFGELIGTIQESYNGERVVKIYDGYDYEKERFRNVNERLRSLTLKAQRVYSAGTPLTQFTSMVGVSIVIVFALIQAKMGMLTVGEFTTFLAAMLLLLPPIRKLSSVNGTTAAMTAAAESLFRMIDELPEKDAGTRTLENYSGAVEFRNVSFAYPAKDKKTINNFTLSVKPGEMIALVGSSGAGKSTLINLIPRFWVPTEGEIYFDGIAQSELTLKSLRKQIGLVSQDVTIFDDTIANNIAYVCRDRVTREQIEAAADAAVLTDFIKALPEGLDSPAGPNGNHLSGGQRQRVSIARAFLKNAPILLLDEATSALDTESEKHIQKSLDTLLKGRTSFVVAHRLSTIINADRIIVMRDGGIAEIGTHEELLAKGGLYNHLYTLQFSKEN